MITRRQSRLLSANSGASNNNNNNNSNNDNNNNNTSTKVDNTTSKSPDIKISKDPAIKCVARMIPDTDAQNITIPTDLFKDFENLKSATKLDSATLMRKLLTDFNKLKESDATTAENDNVCRRDTDVNALLATIKQECPSPEIGHRSPSPYRIPKSMMTSAAELNVNEDLDMPRCRSTKSFQDQDLNLNFINGKVSSPGSQTIDDDNRKRKNSTDDDQSKFTVYLDINNDNCIQHTNKNSPYQYQEYQQHHHSSYKRNMHYKHQCLDPQEPKKVPFVCKTEDLSSYNDGYGVDITHGSKLFKSRPKDEFDRKDRGLNSETVLRYGDNQLGPIGPATDNSDDTETYEIPSSISRDFQSPGPLNHGDRLTAKKIGTDNHYLSNIKTSRYGSLKDDTYGKIKTDNRGDSPDNEIPLDLSIVKIEPNSSYSSTSLPTNLVPTSQPSSPASPNPSFVSTSSPTCPKDYSSLYANFESHVTKPNKRESFGNDFSPEDEKENFHSFQEARSVPDTNPSSLLTFGSVSAIEKPDTKPNLVHVRGSASSSPEIIGAGSAIPRITDVCGSATKSSEHQQMQINIQQPSAVETLLSSSVPPSQQETAANTGDIHQLVVPQINPGFLGPAGQNMTAKFIPLPTSGNASIPVPIPTNVVAVQKNDNCMYVYPMSFPTLTSMPPNNQQLSVPQQVMPVQKLEPLPSFVPDKGPEKDQLKLVAESNIFPGVYTSILKLSSHKRSRSKQDKVKNNPVVNHTQTAALPSSQPPSNIAAAPVSLTTPVSALASQPMTSQAVMFIPTMRPLQNVCVPTTAVGQPQTNFPLTSSPATANPSTNSHLSVPSKQTVTMTSAGVANTHTSSSTGQSIIMVYPHTAISAMGKPVRRRGRPPKLPMLTQLLVDKRPKIANTPIPESKTEPLRVLDQKELPLISPLPFQERVNVTKPEPVPIDVNESVDDKLDGVEIVGETPATVTSPIDKIKKLPVSSNSIVPTVAPTLTTTTSSSSSSSGPLYQEMILSPRSLKNIKPRKPHSANDFMKPNANFICTSFRIRPRAFRSRRNGSGRNRKNAKGSLSTMQQQPAMMANASPQLQHQITQQQLQMHQQQLQKQLQQQIQQQQQQQQQQEQQRREEKARKEEQQHHQKLLQQQQQQLQQQLQQQQQQQQQLQQQQLQQQQQQQKLQQQKQEQESSQEHNKPHKHLQPDESDIYSLPSSPTAMLKGSISPLPSSVSSAAIQHRLENDKSWTSDDNSRGSSPRNFFQELYHCKICNEIVSSEEKASHQRQHIPIRFFCQTCGLEYQSFLARNPACDKNNPSDEDIVESDNGEPIELPEPLQCDRCSDHFSHPKFALNRCLQVQGGNILCDLCGDQFRTFTNFYEHRNKVHEDCGLGRAEHYVCETCGKILYTSKALRLHRKLHLDRTVQCTINDCPRFFHNNMDLLRHIREQHDKTKEFSCIYDGCNKKFMKNFHLQEHIRVKHFNIRAFHCSWPGCTKEFAAERHLKVHLLIHKDEKPLKCEFCDYRCRQRNALNWHMRKHPEAPYKYRKFSINSSDC